MEKDCLLHHYLQYQDHEQEERIMAEIAVEKSINGNGLAENRESNRESNVGIYLTPAGIQPGIKISRDWRLNKEPISIFLII